MDKRQLVDGCKRGDPASVEALYRGYSGKLMGYAGTMWILRR